MHQNWTENFRPKKLNNDDANLHVYAILVRDIVHIAFSTLTLYILHYWINLFKYISVANKK